jgi:hypothetical protein
MGGKMFSRGVCSVLGFGVEQNTGTRKSNVYAGRGGAKTKMFQSSGPNRLHMAKWPEHGILEFLEY